MFTTIICNFKEFCLLEKISFELNLRPVKLKMNGKSNCLGWEPGTEYVYKFTGRSAAGIPDLKQQHAMIEVQSRVVVQSHDENTIVVKVRFSNELFHR